MIMVLKNTTFGGISIWVPVSVDEKTKPITVQYLHPISELVTKTSLVPELSSLTQILVTRTK